MPPPVIMFYDGYCGYCNAMVRLVAGLDRNGVVKFAPIESAMCQELFSRHPELREADTAFLVERLGELTEIVSIRSAIAARLANWIAWPSKLWLLPFKFIPRAIGDIVYNVIARNRNKIFGRYDACPIPPPEIRPRFLL
jgi:predicted DCC family thiol-disulfide oxidoreductase YuxK